MSSEKGALEPGRVAALFIEHGPDLQRFLKGVLRDAHGAEDALQATFVKAVEMGHTAHPDALRSWLFKVALNEALVVRRRLDLRRRVESKLAGSSPATVDGPDVPLTRLETVQRVRQAVEALPREQKNVVQLRLQEGMTFAQIADHLKIPLGTVLTRMRLALRKLRTAIPRDEVES